MLETPRTWILLRNLQAGAHSPPDKLNLLQDNLLRAAVAHAYESVPFYRQFWGDMGFDARKFRGIEELERIPIVTGRLVKEAAKRGELLTRGVDTDKCTYLDTSGSSGSPLRIWKQELEERIRRAVGLRIWFEHGFRWHHMSAQFQILPGPSHFMQRFGISRKIWISTELPIEEQMTRLLEAKADVLIGTPTALRRIAYAIRANGKELKQPLIVFGAGELLDVETSRAINQAFGIDPVGLYGQTEVGYVAWQCEQRNSFHLNADTHLVEVLDDGRQVGPGELGKIVITDLYAKTMPFIRYDTKDLVITASAPCSCNRQLPLLGSIEGRASGSILLRDGRTLTTRCIVNHLAGVLRMGQYRLYQEGLDLFRVELVSGSDVAAGHKTGELGMSNQNLKTAVLKRLGEILGDVQISFETVGPGKPDGTGKTQTVFSNVPIPGLSTD